MTNWMPLIIVNGSSALLIFFLGAWSLLRRTTSAWLALFLMTWSVPSIGSNAAALLHVDALGTLPNLVFPLQAVFLLAFAVETRGSRPRMALLVLAILAALILGTLRVTGVPGLEAAVEIVSWVGTAVALVLWAWDAYALAGHTQLRVLLGLLVAVSYGLAYTFTQELNSDSLDPASLVAFGASLLATALVAPLRLTVTLWANRPLALRFLLPVVVGALGLAAPLLPDSLHVFVSPGLVRLIVGAAVLAPLLLPQPGPTSLPNAGAA